MPRKASPKSTLPPSEDNASQVIINVEDDNLADAAAQLSISEDAASELESLPSQPSQTSHACVSDIQFNTLEYRGQLLKDVQYRPQNKRVLNTKTKVSWVYEHGADLQADGYEKLWLCRRCHQNQAYGSQLFDYKSTSSVATHLKKVHGITDKDNSPASSQVQLQLPTQIGRIQSGLLPPPFNDLEYKKNLVDTIISNDLSFVLIEDARFRQLLLSGQAEIGAILPASHNTIKEWVLDSFRSRKVEVKHKISLARSKINLSLDGWRAPNRDDYIAICAHFIDKDYKIVHCLLGFKSVYGEKSGQATGEITAGVINDYEIGQNLGAFMMDNAKDNDTALKELATRFDIDIKFSRLRCLGHVINLVVKALLFGKGVSKFERQLAGASDEALFEIWNSQGPIGKLHNICVYVNVNSTRQAAFRACQGPTRGEDIKVYRLLVDGGIRWNSTEAMISRGMFQPSTMLIQLVLAGILTHISDQTPRSNLSISASVEASESEGRL
jgi:hypothetical protein